MKQNRRDLQVSFQVFTCFVINTINTILSTVVIEAWPRSSERRKEEGIRIIDSRTGSQNYISGYYQEEEAVDDAFIILYNPS